MSEQVGASLVLAQMLLPAQSHSPSQDSTAGSLSSSSGTDVSEGLQPTDSIVENEPAFASLLTELKNLEARTPAATERPLEALIRVRVETTKPDSTLPSPGIHLQGTGKPVPEAGEPVPEAGEPVPEAGEPVPEAGRPLLEKSALPLTIESAQANQKPAGARSLLPLLESGTEANSLDADEIVVREPGIGGQPPASPPRADGLLVAAPPLQTETPTAQPPGTTAASPPSPAPVTLPMNSDPLTRAADGQLAAAANSGAGGSAKLDAGGDRATGENQGERGGDRQAQPNLNPRGPSITFSLDGLPNATLATVGTSAVPSPITSSPLLSQSLTLLGQPSQWAEPLAQRLAGLATQGANTAEIRLHPPSLGQLDVRITLANDQATLFVASANPEVREALQQALPRLDDLLSGLGIELAESEIAERQADGFQAEGGDNQPDSEPNSGGEPGEQSSEQPGSNRLGMLDTWA